MPVTADAPKQTRGQATRADMIAAAKRLFSEHGYHNTGIADIQQATAMTKGAFYHHFRSKEELALAVLEEVQEQYQQALIDPAMEQHSPGEQLVALLDGINQLNCQPEWCNCQMLATLVAELTDTDQRVREAACTIQTDLCTLIEELIAQAQQAQQASTRWSPETAARWAISTITGALLLQKASSANVQMTDMIDALKTSLLRKNTLHKAAESAG